LNLPHLNAEETPNTSSCEDDENLADNEYEGDDDNTRTGNGYARRVPKTIRDIT
jgi:hypothetical protein